MCDPKRNGFYKPPRPATTATQQRPHRAAQPSGLNAVAVLMMMAVAVSTMLLATATAAAMPAAVAQQQHGQQRQQHVKAQLLDGHASEWLHETLRERRAAAAAAAVDEAIGGGSGLGGHKSDVLATNNNNNNNNNNYDDDDDDDDVDAFIITNKNNEHNRTTSPMQSLASADFIAYMKDFDMQAETSIPEDIFDQQHMGDGMDGGGGTTTIDVAALSGVQHEDAANGDAEQQRGVLVAQANAEDENVAQRRRSQPARNRTNTHDNYYSAAAAEDAAATDDGDDDDDEDDVDDDDEEKHYDNNDRNNMPNKKNNNRNKHKNKYKNHNSNGSNRKKPKLNKDNALQHGTAPAAVDLRQQSGGGSSDDDNMQYNDNEGQMAEVSDTDADAEEYMEHEDALIVEHYRQRSRDQQAAQRRARNMHSDKAATATATLLMVDEQRERPSTATLKICNEGKFNKVAAQKAPQQNALRRKDNNSGWLDVDGAGAAATGHAGAADDDGSDVDEGAHAIVNNKGNSAAAQAQAQVQHMAAANKQQGVDDIAQRGGGTINLADEMAIGDIDDSMARNEDEVTTTTPPQPPPASVEDGPQPRRPDEAAADRDESLARRGNGTPDAARFIARKSKRHDGGRARTFNSGGRVMTQDHRLHWQQAVVQQPQQQRLQDDDDADADDDADDERQSAWWRDGGGGEPAFNDFGILTTSQAHSNKTRQAAGAADGQGNDESLKRYSATATTAQDKHWPRAADGSGATAMTTAEERMQSAFERHKAERRNNRRYGHRSHKKKYKDYLHYMAAMSTTTATSTTSPTLQSILYNNQMATASPIQPATITASMAEMALAATNGKHNVMVGADVAAAAAIINATHTKSSATTNNTNDNYTQQQHERRAEKLRKYRRKIEAEKLRGLPTSPIFAIGNHNNKANGAAAATSSSSATGAMPTKQRDFYEGQINYYVETSDDNDNSAALGMASGHVAHDDDDAAVAGEPVVDTGRAVSALNQREEQQPQQQQQQQANNWFGRVSPALRNGIKQSQPPLQQQHYQQQFYQQQNYQQQQYRQTQLQPHHGHQHHHHNRQHNMLHQHKRKHQHQQHHHQHHYQQQHHRQHHHQQHQQHANQSEQQQQQQNAYQRKMLPTRKSFYSTGMGLGVTPEPSPAPTAHPPPTSTPSAPATSEQTTLFYRSPHAGAMQELGHQITEMKDLERYYAKWPHLARVQLQVYDEHLRESHPELYDGGNNNNNNNYDYENSVGGGAGAGGGGVGGLGVSEEEDDAGEDGEEDANLPPYIKKYNRRNKALLNLLEGTLPPATRPPVGAALAAMRWSSSLLQPGPHDSSGGGGGAGAGGAAGGGGGVPAAVVRLDDDYLKEKRKHYHYGGSSRNNNNNNNNNNSKHIKNLFAEQMMSTTTTTTTTTARTPTTEATSISAAATTTTTTTHASNGSDNGINHLPDENVSVSREYDEPAGVEGEGGDDDFWHKKMATKSTGSGAQMAWQIEKLTAPSTAQAPPPSPPPTPKAAIFKLPSYPAISGSYIGKPRSRSAQFAPSSSGGGAYASYSAGGGGGGGSGVGGNYHHYYKTMPAAPRYSNALNGEANKSPPAAGLLATDGSEESSTKTPSSSSSSSSSSSNRALSNSFVYHRVVDAAPRLVGAGLLGVRKQRLPFVAITDRRLETAKKLAAADVAQQRDYEQNHYPMP